ncbi:sulfatase family protein [Lysobacter enzymogenes]|uniref:sulfatase family protein n=1 Tax=Lysobacter enzymogenes TaxID=69 RepID=UPI0008955C23|nr:sulfatase [Lysobacter enzymogenes]SDX02964.1 Arylsulfatase A [Lysobacter enzymogenes]
MKARLQVFAILLMVIVFIAGCEPNKQGETKTADRPNILVVMSDNQYWSHAGIYGDKVVRTPNMDRVAREGVRFTNAFDGSPSCTPSRAGFLTGQDIWRLREGADLWSILPTQYKTYPDLLEASGYQVGFDGKGWGPGSFEANGRKRNPAGNPYNSFPDFLKAKKAGTPWTYWVSSLHPHRPYEVGSGVKAGIDPARIDVPGYLPDSPEVRSDIADYYAAVEAFDKDLGDALQALQRSGEAGNTVVVVVSDNGWQMPRGLANLYDSGTHVPLIVSWPGKFKAGSVSERLLTLNDLAPTFLDLAKVPVPGEMTGKSILSLLERGGAEPTPREFVVYGRERHAFVRQHGLGYPGRAIRTHDYLYIKNYEASRWPAGDPPLFGDIDPYMMHYPGGAKLYLMAHRDDPAIKPLFDLSMGKRPQEELYDVRRDPDQLRNLAADPAFKAVKEKLHAQMRQYLIETADPRETGGDVQIFDTAPYFSEIDKKPRPGAEAIEMFGLEHEYDYTK